MSNFRHNEELCAAINRSLDIFVSRYTANGIHINRLKPIRKTT